MTRDGYVFVRAEGEDEDIYVKPGKTRGALHGDKVRVALTKTYVHKQEGEKVGAMEIWHRFPKFVLGFLGVSIICSFICSSLGADQATILIENGTNQIGKSFRGWFFALAFVAIGLTTNFRELKGYLKGGKPIILYVCGQTFNLLLTLAMAYIMFYKVFPDITAKI